MPRVPISECRCPYCGAPLKGTPVRKKKCPQCGQTVYVREVCSDRQKYLVTEDELEKVEKEWKESWVKPGTF